MEEDIIRSSVLYPQRKRKKETEKVVSSKNLEDLDSEFPRAVQVRCFYIPVYSIFLHLTAEWSVA